MSDSRVTDLADDKNELADFVIGLWKQKKIILLGAMLGGGLAVGYAFLSMPIYQSKAVLLPPSGSGIAALNLGRGKNSQLAPYELKDIYEVFLRNIQSDSLRHELFNDVYLPSLDHVVITPARDDLYSQFSRKIIITPHGGATKHISVTVLNENPQTAGEWMRILISRAEAKTRAELVDNASTDAQVRAESIQQQIALLREKGKIAKEDLIVRLKEALAIAQAIGIEYPSTLSNHTPGQISAGISGELTYMRGSKALQAEIKSLEARHHDDSFIEGLRSLQIKLDTYKRIKIDPQKISVFKADGEVGQPGKNIKPKNIIIIAVGLVIGAVFGVLVVLFKDVYRKTFRG